jgi:ADP-ribose pyrophosphatase YjhB (NUDIX family)
MILHRSCPHCGGIVETYRNPFPTADVVVIRNGAVLLIRRKNPPEGYALPGGFIDYGETAEAAAVRELAEETGLEALSLQLLGVYSDPNRDPRFHTLTVVFIGQVEGTLKAGDDAAEAQWFPLTRLPEPIAFDHRQIIADAVNFLSPEV